MPISLLRKTAFTLATACVSFAGQAADLAPLYKRPPPMPFSWTGFYLGANAGIGWATKTFDYNDFTPGAPFLWESSQTINGPIAGGQLGYNVQLGILVLGSRQTPIGRT
jgi:outer membrane immunogenic protein